MDQVATAVLELIEMGVWVGVGGSVTIGNAEGVAVGDEARAGKVGEADNVAAALI